MILIYILFEPIWKSYRNRTYTFHLYRAKTCAHLIEQINLALDKEV